VRFGSSAPFSLGVEEELFLVDARTLEPVPLAPELVEGRGPRLKTELFACIAEITTPVCAAPGEVLDELRRLRGEVAVIAERLGATILAAGTHPTARGEGQPISPGPVYAEVAAQLGPAVSRQLVCGLHVHVGVASEQACLRALEGVLPWLPVVLSLSASSPFADGADSGLRSARAERLAELPSGGAPPVFRAWADWEERTAGLDYRRLHWDVRPHPDYGTLEVRMADQQTDVRRSAAFAALVQALVRACGDGPAAPYDRDLYSERRMRAAAEPPDTAELAAVVEPAARELGSWELVRGLLEARPEAERQLELGLPAVVRELADRSIA
jgi:carboxylate-amine ligase